MWEWGQRRYIIVLNWVEMKVNKHIQQQQPQQQQIVNKLKYNIKYYSVDNCIVI